MSDRRLRALERRWKETGAPVDEVCYLREHLRVSAPGGESDEGLHLAVLDFMRLYVLCRSSGLDDAPIRTRNDELRARLSSRSSDQSFLEWAREQPELFPPTVQWLLSVAEREVEGYGLVGFQILTLLRLETIPNADLGRLWFSYFFLRMTARAQLEALVDCQAVIRRMDLRGQLDRLIHQLEDGVPQEDAFAECHVLFDPRLSRYMRRQLEGRPETKERIREGLRKGWLIPSDPGTTPSLRVEVARLFYLLEALTRDGYSIGRAAEVCACWMVRPEVLSALKYIEGTSDHGVPLHAVLARHPRCFPDLVVGLVREQEGRRWPTQGEVLRTIAELLDRRLVTLTPREPPPVPKPPPLPHTPFSISGAGLSRNRLPEDPAQDE